jgi:hypothetical protein
MNDYDNDTCVSGVWAVAPLMGIDLCRAIRDGHMAVDDMSTMLRNCAECWSTRRCNAWRTDGGDRAIGSFCRNSVFLNRAAEKLSAVCV